MEMDACIPDRKSSMEEIWDAREPGMASNRFLRTTAHRDCAVFLARYAYACSIDEIAEQERTVCKKERLLYTDGRGKNRDRGKPAQASENGQQPAGQQVRSKKTI